MEKKFKQYRKRLFDALISNAYNNQLDKLTNNYNLLTSDEFSKIKNRLLLTSLKNGSKECSEFLIKLGAICNAKSVLLACSWDKIYEIYILIDNLQNQFSFTESLSYKNKDYLITRLIEPSKVNDNSERVDYILELLKNGFFSIDEVRNIHKSLYSGKDKYKNSALSLLRELKLTELGI